MRLVHLADVHLGFRQYQRQTPAGINQREADVAAAFTRAVDKIISLAPDIVIVAGDVFHQVRPTNPAILLGFAQMARLARALPDAIIVMLAGNHDTPRSRDTACILRLFTQLGVHVVEGDARVIAFRERQLAITCVPDMRRFEEALAPDPTARFNVLAAHAEIEGLLPTIPGQVRAPLVLSLKDIAHPDWDYVALGHWHVCRQMAPRAWYSGAIDYTSNNPWAEIREQRSAKLGDRKAMIEFDLESAKHTIHKLEVSRPFVDLQPIEGRGLGAVELDARIAAVVEKSKEGIDDNVVRLTLRDVPRHVARDLNHRALREYRRRALHFHLDVRPPEVTRTSAAGAPGRGTTLAETLRERLRDRPLDSELSRERFIALGSEYLTRVETLAAASARSEGEAP